VLITRQLDDVGKEQTIAERLKKEWEAKMARIDQLKVESADLAV
jgi:hypothetical protein